MRCENPKCWGNDEFYVALDRIVKIHTIGGIILDLSVDVEQFLRDNPWVCAKCEGRAVEVTNDDIDAFWKIYGTRIDRKIKNPKWTDEHSQNHP